MQESRLFKIVYHLLDKGHLRKKSKEDWLKMAVENSKDISHPRDGKTVYLDCGFLYKGTFANYVIFTGLLGIVLQKTDIALPFTSNSFIHNSFEVRLTDLG